jgi:hypothetical protein
MDSQTIERRMHRLPELEQRAGAADENSDRIRNPGSAVIPRSWH